MINREFKNIKIGIVDSFPYTGKFTYYDITDKESYIEVIRAFNEEFKPFDNEVEIKLINYDYKGKLNDMNLEGFLNLCEEFPEVQPQDIVYLLQYNYENKVREILEKNILYAIIKADSKWEAFREFARTFDIIQIPEHLKMWIDWEKVLDDYEFDGTLVKRVDYRTYLIVY